MSADTMKKPCTYILASKYNGTLYVGVTSNLVKRIEQHRAGVVEGFSQKYKVHTLVWYEEHENMLSAITREKQIKSWKRKRKISLIESLNPPWDDITPVEYFL